MTTEIDLSSYPRNYPGLFIPHVHLNQVQRVRNVIERLDLTDGIYKIEPVERTTKDGKKFCSVSIHFNTWKSNDQANETRKRLLIGKEIKIVYDDPWFWKCTMFDISGKGKSHTTKPNPRIIMDEVNTTSERKTSTHYVDNRDNRPRDNRPRDNRPRDNRPRDNRPRDKKPRDNKETIAPALSQVTTIAPALSQVTTIAPALSQVTTIMPESDAVEQKLGLTVNLDIIHQEQIKEHPESTSPNTPPPQAQEKPPQIKYLRKNILNRAKAITKNELLVSV